MLAVLVTFWNRQSCDPDEEYKRIDTIERGLSPDYDN